MGINCNNVIPQLHRNSAQLPALTSIVLSCQAGALRKMYKSRQTGRTFELSLPPVHRI